MTPSEPIPGSAPPAVTPAAGGGGAPSPPRSRVGFGEDFRRFFLRGLAALLPTLITLWLIVWAWNFLWENVGRHLIRAVRFAASNPGGLLPVEQVHLPEALRWTAEEDAFPTKLVGVLAAILLVYLIGVLVGNLIGRTAWRLAELAVMKIPLVRAIYPPVKQVTDFLLADRSSQFAGRRVVAVKPHQGDIWSIGLVTGDGLPPLTEATGTDLVTVFVPSTPTAFSGYVLVVPRAGVIELPLTTEEAFRLLISGGVIVPEAGVPAPLPEASRPIS